MEMTRVSLRSAGWIRWNRLFLRWPCSEAQDGGFRTSVPGREFLLVHRTLPIQVNVACQQKNMEKHFKQMCNRKNYPTGQWRRKMSLSKEKNLKKTEAEDRSDETKGECDIVVQDRTP